MKSVLQDNEFEAGNRRLDIDCCQCAWPTGWLLGRREFCSAEGLGWCLLFPLDRGKRRLCAKMRKHRKVFKGKGCHRNSGIVREMKKVGRSTGRLGVQQRWQSETGH